MPVERCSEDGKPGWRWGSAGKCYTYAPGDEDSSNEAKRKAHVQGAAIEKGAKAVAGRERKPIFLQYPENWDQLSLEDKEKVARGMAIELQEKHGIKPKS
jgi:hypothetical protein